MDTREYMKDHIFELQSSQFLTQLKKLWNESLKEVQAWTGFEPMTSAIPEQCSSNWAIRPTGSCIHYEFVIYSRRWNITNWQRDQLPGGMEVQLVEYRPGIAEVGGSNQIQACNFFMLISQLLKLCITAIINHVSISFSALQCMIFYKFTWIAVVCHASTSNYN